MAIAERRLAAEFNRPERRSSTTGPTSSPRTATSRRASPSEAASLAGHLRLGKLVVLYDDNHIQLDGPTAMAWSEDVLERFEAYGWRHAAGRGRQRPRRDRGGDRGGPRRRPAEPDRRPDAHRLRQPEQAGHPEGARLAARPGRGPPRPRRPTAGTRTGPSTSRTRRRELFREAIADGERARRRTGRRASTRYATAHPDRPREFGRRIAGGLPGGWDADLKTYETGTEVATRNASQDAIQALAPHLPELFGGAADLSESNLTDVKGEANFSAEEPGRNLRFGVREHAMGGIANGIAYHGGFIPYVRHVPDVQRLHARLRCGWRPCPACTSSTSGRTTRSGSARTGPTHQPVEHYAALRAIPNLWFVRPGDANETARRLGARGRAAGRTGRARADPPEAPDAGGHGRARPRGRRARRLRAARGGGRQARSSS